MQFVDVVGARRMVRSFSTRSVDPEIVDRIVALAARAPAAGNTQALDVVVLEGEQTNRYWSTTLSDERRAAFPWPGLLRAPVLLIPLVQPAEYVRRYSEPDKASTGLGEGEEQWPIPYWYVDGAFAAMVMLLATVDAGLGACFFGQFEHEEALRHEFGWPTDRRALGTIALGWPDEEQRLSKSAQRKRKPIEQLLHRGGW